MPARLLQIRGARKRRVASVQSDGQKDFASLAAPLLSFARKPAPTPRRIQYLNYFQYHLKAGSDSSQTEKMRHVKTGHDN